MLLTPIFEAEFRGFSCGFRPGRGQHDAPDALAFGIWKRRVDWKPRRAALSWSMIACGVPAGANRPNQLTTS